MWLASSCAPPPWLLLDWLRFLPLHLLSHCQTLFFPVTACLTTQLSLAPVSPHCLDKAHFLHKFTPAKQDIHNTFDDWEKSLSIPKKGAAVPTYVHLLHLWILGFSYYLPHFDYERSCISAKYHQHLRSTFVCESGGRPAQECSISF